MIQKHKVINELNAKVVDLTKKCSALEEKLYMAENDVPSHLSRTPSVFDEIDSISSSIVKKRKLDNYVHPCLLFIFFSPSPRIMFRKRSKIAPIRNI